MNKGIALLKTQSTFLGTLIILAVLSIFDILLSSRVIPNYPAVQVYRIILVSTGVLSLAFLFTYRQHDYLFHLLFLFVFALIRLDEVMHIIPRLHAPDLLLSLFVFSNFLALFIVIAFTSYCSPGIIAFAFCVYAIFYELLYFRRMRELPPIFFIMVLATTGAVSVISVLMRIERRRKREIGRLLDKEVFLRNSIARMKGRMLEQEKTFSLSMLTAGIAHELGNPVNYVRGNLYFIDSYFQSLIRMINRETLEASAQTTFDRICGDYQSIIKHAEVGFDTIIQIIDNMKKLYGTQRNSAERTNVKEMLTRTADFFRISHKGIPCSIQLDIPQDLYCNFNQGEYYIVFTNLLLNALESLEPEQGNGCIKISACESDGEIMVAIADNGRGIDQEQLHNVFDPFYSTKGETADQGHHLGLGLALCKEIVESNRGTISIESVKKRGTIVQVLVGEFQDEYKE